MTNAPRFHTIRFVSTTPRAMDVETMINSKKTETTKKAIIATNPVVPVHLKKYCLHPVVVCLGVVKGFSHRNLSEI